MWSRFFKPILEWLGHLTVVQAIVGTEFVRTALWPTVLALLTGGAGIFGGQPLMWVFMASTLAFAGTMLGLFVGSLYLERKNPHNKLKYKGTHFQCDLEPARVPAQGQSAAKTRTRSGGTKNAWCQRNYDWRPKNA